MPIDADLEDSLFSTLNPLFAVTYPLADLGVAIEVVRAIRRLGEPDPLLIRLMDPLGRADNPLEFPKRIATARIFGLVVIGDRRIHQTELGERIANPAETAAAKVEAFMGVPLYASLFERYSVAVLPQVEDMELELRRRGIAAEHASEVRIAFHRSAMVAGFFSIGAHRLIMPRTSSRTGSNPPLRSAAYKLVGRRLPGVPRANIAPAPATVATHPLIDGLVAALPEPGTSWPLEARRKWLQSAALNFDLLYGEPPVPGSISVSLEQ